MTDRAPRSTRTRLVVGVFAIALLGVLGLVVALQNATTALIAVGAGLAAVLFWLWRRNSEAALTVLSLGAAAMLTSEIVAWVGQRVGAESYLQTSLVYWIFCGVTVSATWLVRRQRRNRALTVALAHACLVIASVFTFLAPSVIPIAGMLMALAVVYLRGRARHPSLPAEVSQDQSARPSSIPSGRAHPNERRG